jgi:branched-chain amino acid transport system ATP-binding protein
LEARGVSLRVGGLQILDGVSIAVEAGTVTGMVGPNGAGKTTLMNIFSGLTRASSGSVFHRGKDITRMRPARRAMLGFARTYQDGRAPVGLTVEESVMVGALYGAQPTRSVSRARERARDALERVGLVNRSHLQATAVSTGQQKLMDIARALLMHPDVLILDEPLAALSSRNQDIVLGIVEEQSNEGRTVLLVEHVMRAVLRVSDRVVVMHEGKVLIDDVPKVIVRDSRVVDAYLGAELSASLHSETQ